MSLWHTIPCYKSYFDTGGDFWANEAILDEFGLVELQAGKIDDKPVQGDIEGEKGGGKWPVYTTYLQSFSDYKSTPRMARMDDIRAKDGWSTSDAKVKLTKVPAEGPVSFAQKPEVVRSGNEAKIKFAVSRETDVCVNIVDDKNHVIRHLASGVLGAAAPAPLKSGSLSQEINWDFKDDDGRTTPPGNYHARIGLSLAPAFERAIPMNVGGKSKKDNPAMWSDSTHLQVETLPNPPKNKIVDETHGGGAKNLVALDVQRNELYLPGYEVYDATSGKLLRNFMPARAAIRYPELEGGQELAFGKDGMIYTTGYTGLWRLDTKGSPVPFETTGRADWPNLYLAHSNPHRGHCVGPNGDIYVIHHFIGHGNMDCQISEVAPDGRLKRYGFIELRGITASSLAVDNSGNVYVGVSVNPKDHAVPDELNGLPADIKFTYELSYGSVVKFGPGGGRVVWDDSATDICGARHYGGHKKYGCKLEGAEWIHPGMSLLLTRARGEEAIKCVCRQSRFALDPAGRLFVPDAVMGRVQVIDAAGNTIRYIGSRGSAAEKLQFRWPENILAGDDYCYICDYLHMQCVQVRLAYQASEEIAISK
jgi:hypothetical protein